MKAIPEEMARMRRAVESATGSERELDCGPGALTHVSAHQRELAVVREILEVLEPFDEGARRRVLAWACDYFGHYELRDVLQQARR